MAMLCPRCAATELALRERDGVAIDVCPSCRGVWLDRGELERLQAHAAELGRAKTAGREARDEDDDREESRPARRKKKKSLLDLLEDILD